jgi:beta-phosphoglucomutase-like phosphatase (HAD superfamily)
MEGAKCLVFEDARSGVEAGFAANFDVIWIPDEKSEPCPSLQKRCRQVIYSMEEFNPEMFGF